eukprot:3548475-Prymnesium_polylepis.1
MASACASGAVRRSRRSGTSMMRNVVQGAKEMVDVRDADGELRGAQLGGPLTWGDLKSLSVRGPGGA